MGLFDWLKQRQRPVIPVDLWTAILARHPFFAHLTTTERADLKRLSEAFLAEKEFSTVGDLELSDEICVTIAAQGCLPILKQGLAAYRDWVGIIVYPDEFVVPRHVQDEDGVVHEFEDVLSGEAWLGGPLLVSWQDVQLAGDGYNVVIHEFAHKLDMQNGEADGLPILPADIAVVDWESVFATAYDDLCQRVDKAEETGLDPYAASDPAEFFAVTSECFFASPALLAGEYPALYRLLARYYRQDPLKAA